MKKKIIVCVLCILMLISLTGCFKGENITDDIEVPFKVIINYGRTYASTFQDPDTGIWYIIGGNGICPRYNPDGSLYVTEVE